MSSSKPGRVDSNEHDEHWVPDDGSGVKKTAYGKPRRSLLLTTDR